LVLASKAGLLEENYKNYERLEEIPFNSENKFMAVLAEDKKTKKKIYYLKGALEVIVEKCKKYFENNKIKELSEKQLEIIKNYSNIMANESLMTMGLAYGDNLDDLIFLGMIGK
jgi:Ca2+-transporting ATPase